MGFFNGLNKLMFGENTSRNKYRELYDKAIDNDKRLSDFEKFSSYALNNMANRGIINSSVTSAALSSALSSVEDNYWNNQMKLLGYGYGRDKEGLAGNMFKSATSGIFKALL